MTVGEGEFVLRDEGGKEGVHGEIRGVQDLFEMAMRKWGDPRRR